MKRSASDLEREGEELKRIKGSDVVMDPGEPEPIVDVGDVTAFTTACYNFEYATPSKAIRNREIKQYHFDLKNALGEKYDVLEREYLHPPENIYIRPKRGIDASLDVASTPESKAVPLLKEYRNKQKFLADSTLNNAIAASRSVRDAIADGSLSLTAVQVGHGDCTVLKTPLGKIIMIDCGSAGHMNEVGSRMVGTQLEYVPDTEVLDQIRAMLGTKRVVDILILTHADQDHHNKLRWMADSIGITKFSVVYHTDKLDQFKVREDADKYASTAVLALAELAQIKRVALNLQGCRIFPYSGRKEGIVPPAALGRGNAVEWLDPDGSLVIHKEENCTIRLVAAEVDAVSDLNEERPALADNPAFLNGASIVTLIEGCGQKILISGDATIKTEAFMLRKFPGDLLKNLTLLRIAHHGSNLNCSGKDFIDHVHAATAIVSTGYRVDGHCFPKVDVLQRCWPHISASDTPNNIWYWVGVKKIDSQHDSLFADVEKLFSKDAKNHLALKKKKLWGTGSTGAVTLNFPAPT